MYVCLWVNGKLKYLPFCGFDVLRAVDKLDQSIDILSTVVICFGFSRTCFHLIDGLTCWWRVCNHERVLHPVRGWGEEGN